MGGEDKIRNTILCQLILKCESNICENWFVHKKSTNVNI